MTALPKFPPRWLAAFLADRRGVIALKFALAVPALALLSIVAMELNVVHAAKGRIQDIADSAALAGARDLSLAIDDDAAVERARAFVEGGLEEWAGHPEIESEIEVIEENGQRILHVDLRGVRPSFFVNLLPPGGWKFRAEASAASVAVTPLCVLVTATSNSKVLNVKDSSQLKAPACLVHSNRDIVVEGGSIAAAMSQAVTSASGSITPDAGTGAAEIDDPFAQLGIDRQAGLGVLCTVADLLIRIKVSSGTHYIPAGRHCGGIEASGTARVILQPGEHFFLKGALVVKEDARLEGQDVALFFDQASKFDFTDRALVNLDGRKTGPFAGIVMGAMRDNKQDFVISADNVESLLGVIYVPSARLIVEGDSEVARDSAWTVIVAHEVQLKGSPSLIINANYQGSSVPVPDGVGPRAGGAHLIR